MTKQLEQLTDEQVNDMLKKGLIKVICGAILTGPDFVSGDKAIHEAVMNVTDKDILDESDYYYINSSENGVYVGHYSGDKNGSEEGLGVNSGFDIYADYFAKIAKEEK